MTHKAHMTHMTHMPTSEATEQAKVVAYLRGRGWLFSATANGVGAGRMQWVQLARSGVAPGVPDLLVFEAVAGYRGVAIELKTARGKVSIEQARWIEALRDRGWYAFVAYGADEAIAKLEAL